MNKEELDEVLLPIKKALRERIKSRGMLQAIINRYIQEINYCIAQNVTIRLIHNNLFPDNDVSFIHLKNLIHRARDKFAKNRTKEATKDLIKEDDFTQTNVFSSLAKKETQPIHNSSSDQESAEERLNKLLMQKKQNEA
ncbi:hypothetical protein [Gilliamella sp. BG6]|uniref:hypothetical protein n=1 Tax=unclassified Gilliamella TaxID=2685620 RepID=UPI0039861358